MISLRQVHYALAVEETLHFRKAAEQCSISQSALSTALAEMEKQLGFQIFERDNKKVLVTPLGREVLEKARVIKREMSDLQRLAELHGKPLSSPMSIGLIPTIAPYLLPIILPPLRAGYPDLELEVSEAQSPRLVELVRSGDLDAGILALPYDIDGLLAFRFWRENFYWVAHRDDNSVRTKRIRADQIDATRLMLLEEGHCLKDHALAVCQLSEAGLHNLSATSLATLVQLVAGKMGSTLVPEMAVASLVDPNPSLRKLPLSERGPHREIAFIVRPTYPGVRSIETLKALFSRELKQHLSKA
ncbi:MAG TPA: hydrogen peroxide-inducible genes activator [Gammaproteobacteria bacterium]